MLQMIRNVIIAGEIYIEGLEYLKFMGVLYEKDIYWDYFVSSLLGTHG